jgi:xylan 1,4-beta-xylosidase
MVAEGGTEHYHSVTIARSKNIFGPYEANPGNPILTHRHLGKNYSITNIGHADIVETQNGEWYMVALGSRPYGGYYKNLTRETFLIPMDWENDWPIVSPGTGRVEFTYPVPNLPEYSVRKREVHDDFDNETLDYIWNSYHTPREEFWSLTERPGYLRLKVRPKNLIQVLEMPPYEMKIGPSARQREKIIDNPSFIGRRQQHMDFNVNTKMEFNPKSENEAAGIALIQDNNHHFRFEYTIEDGKKVIRLVEHIAKVDMDFAARTFEYENIETKLAQEIFDSEVIYLKVTAKGQDYSFYYGNNLDNMKVLMENVDGRILCSEVAGGCSGTYIGMFASSNGEISNNVADFDYFEYKGQS